VARFVFSILFRIVIIGETLFCHATPRSDEELFTLQTNLLRPLTAAEALAYFENR
jgi:hypothetical protein